MTPFAGSSARWAAAGAVLLVAGCGPLRPPGTLVPATRSLGAIEIWMECIECWSHEADDVAALGPAAVPTLRQYLLDGPPASAVARLTAVVAASLTDSALVGLPPISIPARTAVLTKQVADYRIQYQVRAATGLGLIGGPAAVSALCQARAGQPAPPVAAAIDAALARLGATCP